MFPDCELPVTAIDEIRQPGPRDAVTLSRSTHSGVSLLSPFAAAHFAWAGDISGAELRRSPAQRGSQVEGLILLARGRGSKMRSWLVTG